ncbi:GNAT family N-acetyltransferase [Nocardioides houyundeii]|uniref:GNAT family N-acetyltransferase n=1 Tax=Nocardioides houyundeii TaxID=2045452 RepID=UPI001963D709|nr:GNAT family N-acetyltransferase [Nocardioides houyundeii]
MTSAEPDSLADVVVRPGGPEDLAEVAALYVAARFAAVPDVPAPVRLPEEMAAWVRGWDLGTHDLFVAHADGDLVGFALATATWLDHLYVAPDRTGQGIGSLLLGLVQAMRPDGFGLWVFASNRPAQRFYARHGFVEVERTDGSDNEERAPDVHLAWPGSAT